MGRDWSVYNEKKVKEIELLFNPDYLRGRLNIREISNEGKKGRPFIYTNSQIALYTIPAVYMGLPFRQAEGLARLMGKIFDHKDIPDYTTLWRRKNRLNLKLRDVNMGKKTTIAIDATGIKVTNRGDWIRKKWKKEKRGYIKLHLAVDTETKEIIAYEVTDESVGDNRKFKKLINKSMKKRKVKKVLADGAYDSKDNFKSLEKKGIKAGIKVRKNISKARGCMLRKKIAVEQKDWE